jgi:hypothetical protein
MNVKFATYELVPVGAEDVCPDCGGKNIDLLCAADAKAYMPAYYVCWSCHSVRQVGVGKVERREVEEKGEPCTTQLIPGV